MRPITWISTGAKTALIDAVVPGGVPAEYISSGIVLRLSMPFSLAVFVGLMLRPGEGANRTVCKMVVEHV